MFHFSESACFISLLKIPWNDSIVPILLTVENEYNQYKDLMFLLYILSFSGDDFIIKILSSDFGVRWIVTVEQLWRNKIKSKPLELDKISFREND